MQASITAVLVTYGERLHLLRQALQGLACSNPKPSRVVVVDNGTPHQLQGLDLSWPWPLHVVRLPGNQGSAAGFAAGLSHVLETPAASESSELIWLLDDDNVPEPDALGALGSFCHPGQAALALRPERAEYLMALARGTPLRLLRHSFMKLHWRQLRRGGVPHPATLELDWAPYGGLLIHRSDVKAMGLPRTDFFLYGDDHEWTHRLRRKGGTILLVAGARVLDVDRSWIAPTARRLHPYFDPEADEVRAAISLRNRVCWERSLGFGGPMYWFHAAAWFVRNGLPVFLRHPRSVLLRTRVLLQAVRRGLRASARDMGPWQQALPTKAVSGP